MPNDSDAASSRFPYSFPSERSVAIVDVVVPRHLHRVFSYRVPPHLVGLLAIGSWVRVPFGRSIVNGLVIAWSPTGREPPSPTPVTPYRLRDIADLADPDGTAAMLPELFTLIRLVAEHYVAPLGQCLHLALPPMQSRKANECYVATSEGQAFDPSSTKSLSASALAMLARVKKRPAGLTAATLRRVAGPSFRRDLASLTRHRLIRAASGAPRARRPRARDASPLPSDVPVPASAPPGPSLSHRLTPVQQALHTGRPARFLLRQSQEARLPWVLGLIDVAMAEHRTVLVLIGEIRKAQRLATLIQSHTGQPVALWHSDLPVVVRRERWQDIRRGAYRIVVGTRSSVFAPLTGLGVVVVEDEHDDAYKEESEPRYHARTVAWMRVKLEKAVLVLTSAHPSLETLETLDALEDENRTVELATGGSSGNASPSLSPTTTLVDVVDVRRHSFGTLFSEAIIAGIRHALDRRTLCVLFLNRTGFAPALICRDCGQTPQCTRCSVSMTFYKRAARLGCRYCGLCTPLPDVCPGCSAARLEPFGIGTEAVEEHVRRLFPTATTARMDRETVSASFRVALEAAIAKGKVDILVGTQMLIQGPALPEAGFVGIVDADAGLHRPDFRASEQSYHALVDVTRLTGPASRGGHVVLQTRLPTHHVIRAIADDSSQTFYEAERTFRRLLGYPPYADLILLHASAASEARAREAAQHVAHFLRPGETSGGFSVWGPIPSPLGHVRGRHRWQIAVKATHGAAARAAVQKAVQALEEEPRHRGVKLDVDVDPISMG